MDRSRLEGAQHESTGRGERSHECEPAFAQFPLDGLSGGDTAHLEAGERLSRLLVTLESNIIPRLARAHGVAGLKAHVLAPVPVPAVSSGEVELFARLLIAADDRQARGTVDDLLTRGVARETLYIALLAPAARRLGDMWVDDECTFGDVTVGVGRLHRLMRELVSAGDTDAEIPLEGRRMLLLASPGEQHTLGLSIVSEFFRAARWDVTCTTDTVAPDPVTTVKAEWFDVIGFSAGTHTRLDWLAIAIADARRASRNSGIVVLVGGPVFSIHPEYVATVGADASAADGQQAPIVAERLLRQRA